MTSKDSHPDQKVYDERCCQTGCDGCPYGFEAELDPSVPTEFQIEKLNQNKATLTEEEEKYLEQADKD